MLEFIKWGCKSALALGINLALLTVWVDIAGVAPEFAVFINMAAIPPVMYLVTDRWVFSGRASPTSFRGHVKQFVGMYSANGISKAGNYVLYLALIWLSVPYQLAWAIGAIVMFVLSFGLNRRWWAALSESQPA